MRVLILKLKIVESKKNKKLIEKTSYKTVLHKMDFSIREIIRETRAAINTRLDMLEMLIQNGKPQHQNQSNPVDLSNIEIMLNLLTSKINSIEDKVNNIVHSKHEELPSIILNDDVVEEKKITDCKKVEEEEEEAVEEEVQEEEVQEEEVQEEIIKEEEIVEEEQEEQEEVVEEQELTEFEYKGMILYRDGENKVYQMDEDGELVDTPIGVWNETKQKVLRI